MSEPDRTDQRSTDGEDDQAPREPRRADRGKSSLWREIPVLIVVAIGLAFVIKSFLVQAFFIPSASMEKTLHGCDGCTGDRVLVNKLVYDLRDPHRGEIVVFNGKGTGFQDLDEGGAASRSSNAIVNGIRDVQSFVGLGSNPRENDFIKRVIAVGGDTISCPAIPGNTDYCRNVVVDGHPVNESAYLYEDAAQGDNYSTLTGPDIGYQQPFPQQTVGTGQLFVMGDHRDDSSDSRPHGTIPVSAVVGRAFVKVWPPARIGGLGVPKVWQKGIAAATGVVGANAASTIGLAGAVPLLFHRRRRRLKDETIRILGLVA